MVPFHPLNIPYEIKHNNDVGMIQTNNLPGPRKARCYISDGPCNTELGGNKDCHMVGHFFRGKILNRIQESAEEYDDMDEELCWPFRKDSSSKRVDSHIPKRSSIHPNETTRAIWSHKISVMLRQKRFNVLEFWVLMLAPLPTSSNSSLNRAIELQHQKHKQE